MRRNILRPAGLLAAAIALTGACDRLPSGAATPSTAGPEARAPRGGETVVQPAALSVQVQGPTYIRFDEPLTYTIQASGGSGTYTYQWYAWHPGVQVWNAIGTSQTYTINNPCDQRPSLKLRGHAFSSGQEGSHEIDIYFEAIEDCPS